RAVFASHRHGDLEPLHSFPTRRSSDLERMSCWPHADGRCGAKRCRYESAETKPYASDAYDTGVLSKAGRTGGLKITFRIERVMRSEEHTSELQSRENLVCRLLLEKKKM